MRRVIRLESKKQNAHLGPNVSITPELDQFFTDVELQSMVHKG